MKTFLDKNIINKRFYIDSRNTKENSVFICIKGRNNDGHKFAKNILKNFNKTIVVCEKNSKHVRSFNRNRDNRILFCNSTRNFLTKMAQIKRLILKRFVIP